MPHLRPTVFWWVMMVPSPSTRNLSRRNDNILAVEKSPGIDAANALSRATIGAASSELFLSTRLRMPWLPA